MNGLTNIHVQGGGLRLSPPPSWPKFWVYSPFQNPGLDISPSQTQTQSNISRPFRSIRPKQKHSAKNQRLWPKFSIFKKYHFCGVKDLAFKVLGLSSFRKGIFKREQVLLALLRTMFYIIDTSFTL